MVFRVKSSFAETVVEIDFDVDIYIYLCKKGWRALRAGDATASCNYPKHPFRAIGCGVYTHLTTCLLSKSCMKKLRGLRGYSTLRMPGLIQLIAEAHAPVFLEHAVRALKTGCYPALTREDIDNRHTRATERCINLKKRWPQRCVLARSLHWLASKQNDRLTPQIDRFALSDIHGLLIN